MPSLSSQSAKTAGWVIAQQSGLNPSRIVTWRSQGLLKEGRDFVVMARRSGRTANPLRLYRPERLQELARTDRRKRGFKADRRVPERCVIDGVRYLSTPAAAKRLGICESALRNLAVHHPELLTPRSIPAKETISRRSEDWWPAYQIASLREKEKAKRRLRQGEVDLPTACAIAGLSAWSLRDKEFCEREGISFRRDELWLDQKEASGTFGPRVLWAFRKTTLHAYRKRSAVQRPEGTLTVQEVAAIVGRSTATVRLWCRERLLDAVEGEIRGGGSHARQRCYWISRESAEEARAVVALGLDRFETRGRLESKKRQGEATERAILTPSAPSILGEGENREGLGPASSSVKYGCVEVENTPEKPLYVRFVDQDERSKNLDAESPRTARKRGRPVGAKDPEAEQKRLKVIEEFKAGTCTNIAALGRRVNLSRSRVHHILKDAGVLS
jgi:hypothetical protein